MNKLSKRMDEFNDRIWLRANKKPSGKKASYANMILPWIVVGIGIVTSLGMTVSSIVSGCCYLVPVILITYTAVFAAMFIESDSKKGYIDAIHNHYLEHREAKIAAIKAKGKGKA